MNSIADALRKIRPELNCRTKFVRDGKGASDSPGSKSTSAAATDGNAQGGASSEPSGVYTLDASTVASALAAGPIGPGLSISNSTNLSPSEPLARRLMRRSLQGIALLCVAGLAGAVISSESFNLVSARVEPRQSDLAAASTPVEDVALAAAVSVPSEFPVVPAPDAVLVAANHTLPVVESVPVQALSAAAEVAADLDGLLGTEPREAVLTAALEPVMVASAPPQSQPTIIKVEWHPVATVVSAPATPVAPAKRLSPSPSQAPIRPASVETVWAAQADQLPVAEIPFESDTPLFAIDAPEARGASVGTPPKRGTQRAAGGSLKLEGIFWEKERPMALINGEIVEQGETFRGVKILEIHRTRLVISENGSKRVLAP